jgi:hypothetical protein
MENPNYKPPNFVIILALLAAGMLGCARQAVDGPINPYNETAARPLPEMAATQVVTLEARSKTSSSTVSAVNPLSSPIVTMTAHSAAAQDLEHSITSTAAETSTPSATITPAGSITTPITKTVIGRSYENRPIFAYQFGTGLEPVVLVGGIHGGYEWNSILLAYEAVDYFSDNPEMIPDSATLFIVPVANPDGQYVVTGIDGRFEPEDLAANTVPGRFNGRGVDLNRNWDCQWSETAYWGQQPVNPGTSPFSEPESRSLRDFFTAISPQAVIFYHSAADGVFAAGCPDADPLSSELAGVYASATGYRMFDSFDHYDVTGDAGNWLAEQGIPSISVELATHEDVEWEKNKRGILEVLANLTPLSPKETEPVHSLLQDD